MPTDHYIATDTYRLMLDRIASALVDPGHDLRTKLTEIMADAGIVPCYCRPASAHQQKEAA